MSYKISNESLRKWFNTLSDEEKIEYLGAYVEKPSTLGNLLEHRESLIEARNSMVSSFDNDILKLTEEIEQICNHVYGDAEFLYNNDDGWSKRKITSTYRHKCTICGKVETFDQTSR